jgi:hypothetical protein
MPVSTKESLLQFLQSVADKNKEVFLCYLSEPDFSFAVLPNGSMLTDFNTFIDSQNAWFADSNSTFTYTLQSLQEIDTFAYSYIIAQVADAKDSFTVFISMVFTQRANNWKFVSCQNTVLSK